MIKYYIKQAIKRMRKYAFDVNVKAILNTAPIKGVRSEDVVIVCQVHKAALYMALLALKSFMKNFARGRFELINDGSLTKDDEALFKAHLPNVNFTHIKDIDVGCCPNGGCWERLVHIANLAKDSYVIQVDSDTLTTKPLTLIDNLVNENRAFLIGAPVWDNGISVDFMAHLANTWPQGHVQVEGERVLNNITSIDIKRYLRGCAALSGFPKDPSIADRLQMLSKEMSGLVDKEKWCEWGSEQLTSNLLVSSYEDATMLPWPEYQNFDIPNVSSHGYTLNVYETVTLFHFIGETRFNGGIYKKLSKSVITHMS